MCVFDVHVCVYVRACEMVACCRNSEHLGEPDLVPFEYANDLYPSGFKGKRVALSKPAAGVVGAKETIFYDGSEAVRPRVQSLGGAAMSEQLVRVSLVVNPACGLPV